jgi:hypothetical protein
MKNGKNGKKIPDSGDELEIADARLAVIRALNEYQARYLIIGGVACNFHGLVRATKDIGLLIPKGDVNNTQRILDALKESQAWGMAGELDAEKVADKPFTIIGDQPRVDLLTVAGKIKFEEALKTAVQKKVDQVPVIFADIDVLIKTKNTNRLQDKSDIEQLKEIKKISRK